MKFDRPTGLAMQLQKSDEERRDVKEFDGLREHYERVSRSNNPMSSVGSLLRSSGSLNLPPSLLSGLSSLTSLTSKSYSLYGVQTKKTPIPEYSSESAPENKKIRIERLMALQSDEVSTLAQRINQMDDQSDEKRKLRPQRIELRTKRSKKCRECEKFLIKPEQKAQIPKFKMQFCAINFFPTITIAQPLPDTLIPEQLYRIRLRFSNPIEEEIKVNLSTSAVSGAEQNPIPASNCDVTLLSPSFSIAPFNELSEPEDAKIYKSLPTGIIERSKNYVVVELEVKPQRRRTSSARVEIPLLVSISRTLEKVGSFSASNSSQAPIRKSVEEVVSNCWILVEIGAMK